MYNFYEFIVNYLTLKGRSFQLHRDNAKQWTDSIDRIRFPRLAEPAILSGLQRWQYAVVDTKNQESPYSLSWRAWFYVQKEWE